MIATEKPQVANPPRSTNNKKISSIKLFPQPQTTEEVRLTKVIYGKVVPHLDLGLVDNQIRGTVGVVARPNAVRRNVLGLETKRSCEKFIVGGSRQQHEGRGLNVRKVIRCH